MTMEEKKKEYVKYLERLIKLLQSNKIESISCDSQHFYFPELGSIANMAGKPFIFHKEEIILTIHYNTEELN